MIKHQKQPTSKSCVMTCLAMIMEEPVDNVIEKYGESCDDISLVGIMIECGIIFNKLVFPMMIRDGLYMISVPSLNLEGSMHMVIVEIEERQMVAIIDPNHGRPNKKHYGFENEFLEVPLTTWEDTYEVELSGKLPECREEQFKQDLPKRK